MVSVMNAKNLVLILFVSMYGCGGKPVDYRDAAQIPEESGLFDLILKKDKKVTRHVNDEESIRAQSEIDNLKLFRAWKNKFSNSSELDQYKMWICLKEDTSCFEGRKLQ